LNPYLITLQAGQARRSGPEEFLAVLFLLFDSITELLMAPQVVHGTAKLGYPVSTIPVIGMILLVLIIRRR